MENLPSEVMCMASDFSLCCGVSVELLIIFVTSCISYMSEINVGLGFL